MNHHEQRDEPDGVGDESAPIKCPKCGAMMKTAAVGAVEIDRCSGCNGLWLDALEKEALLQNRSAARAADTSAPAKGSAGKVAAPDGKAKTLCPRDHSLLIHMVDHRQPHIGFESCKVCGGVFLDAGELRDLSEFTIGERLRRVLKG
jgi:Zn-finger nucleic acid-binding protein